jgi:CubicO group peptidase (beta-lactamase class C family)
MQVLVGTNPDGSYITVPANKPITIRHLLMHTAGFSYGAGFGATTAIDGEYNQYMVPFMSLNEFMDKLSTIPLLFHPGTQWKYSWSFEVLGSVIEVRGRGSSRMVERLSPKEVALLARTTVLHHECSAEL